MLGFFLEHQHLLLCCTPVRLRAQRALYVLSTCTQSSRHMLCKVL